MGDILEFKRPNTNPQPKNTIKITINENNYVRNYENEKYEPRKLSFKEKVQNKCIDGVVWTLCLFLPKMNIEDLILPDNEDYHKPFVAGK